MSCVKSVNTSQRRAGEEHGEAQNSAVILNLLSTVFCGIIVKIKLLVIFIVWWDEIFGLDICQKAYTLVMFPWWNTMLVALCYVISRDDVPVSTRMEILPPFTAAATQARFKIQNLNVFGRPQSESVVRHESCCSSTVSIQFASAGAIFQEKWPKILGPRCAKLTEPDPEELQLCLHPSAGPCLDLHQPKDLWKVWVLIL